jgi:hypothetical protein
MEGYFRKFTLFKGTKANLFNAQRYFQLAGSARRYSNQLASDALAKANYMTQLESDLANSIAQAYTDRINALSNIDDNYYSMMAELAATQKAYKPTKTSANNEVESVSVEQGGSGNEKNAAQYAALANYAQMLRRGGASTDTIIGRLSNSGANNDQIANILNQLGL